MSIESITLNDFTERIKDFGGFGYNAFLSTIASFEAESRPFELQERTPTFPLEIAKAAESNNPITLLLSINGEKTVEMTSQPVEPGEPIRVHFDKNQFSDTLSAPPDFTFAIQLKNTPFRKSGMMFLAVPLTTPIAKGGIKSKPGTIMHFRYDFYNAKDYEFLEENHLPAMSIIFKILINKSNENLSIESVRLVVHYDPHPIATMLDQGLSAVYNVSRYPAKLVTALPNVVDAAAPVEAVQRIDDMVVADLKAMNVPSMIFAYTSEQTLGKVVGKPKFMVPWGNITDLAIAATIVKLSPESIDNRQFLESVLTDAFDDQRGRDVVDALTRLYGSKDRLPTVRQLLMHTSGLVQHPPEDFYHRFLDLLESGSRMMAQTPLLSMLPTFSRSDDELEAELVTLLNLISPLTDVVFPINTAGSLLYDYAILAMIIKRLSKDITRSAQDVIKSALGLKGVVHWNVQYSRDAISIEEGPTTIYTLKDALFSDVETLDRFIRSIATDPALTEKFVLERVHDDSKEGMELFRTLVWQGQNALDNPIPIFFRETGKAVTAPVAAIVYMVPHMRHYGVLAVAYNAGDLMGVDMGLRLAEIVLRRVSDVSSAAFKVKSSDVMALEVHPGEIGARTTASIQEIGGTPVTSIVKVGDIYTSPFVNPLSNQPNQLIVTSNPENPNSRIDLVAKNTGLVAARLVLDQRTGHFHAMGEKIDGNERVVHPSPMYLDNSKFVGQDNVYYRNVQALPAISKINANVNAYQKRLDETPVSMMVIGPLASSSSSPLEPLTQRNTNTHITQLPISHCHHKHKHRSYVNQSRNQPYSSQLSQ